MFVDKHTGIFSRHIEVIVYMVQIEGGVLHKPDVREERHA